MTTDLFNDFRCAQIWQNFDSAQVAAFCADAGLNAVMVKALDGAWWMGTPDAAGHRKYAGNPASGEEAGAMRDFFHSLGIKFGVWTNPLFGDDAFLETQAAMTATAGMWCDFLALDCEPFDAFWGANRAPGKAALFVNRVRELAPGAVLVWQPDPRPRQIVLLRPEEWAPVMNAWGGQHYFDVFGEEPEAEVANAVSARDDYAPGGALIPTFSIERATPDQMRRATATLRAAGGDGFIIWRYGLPNDLALAKAAVEGWRSAAPAPPPTPAPELPDSVAATVWQELSISYASDQRLRAILDDPDSIADLDARLQAQDRLKARLGLTP